MAAEFPAPHRLLAAAYVQLGDPRAAVAHLASVPSVHWEPPTLACLAHALGVSGDRSRAQKTLDHLDTLAHTRYVSRYYSAIAWTGVGDVDKAFALLSCACDERDPALMLLTTEPRFSPLRGDSRYDALVERLGIDREITAHV
jgi:hypothetical protein